MNFKSFFGIEASAFKETCIVCQIYDMSLFADNSISGMFVKTAQNQNATIVGLKNSFLAGDAVLLLKETKCKTVFLFGSCGGTGDVSIGDLVVIDKAYNFESFSQMLAGVVEPDFAQGNPDLAADLIKTNSACVSSLLLENRFIDTYTKYGVNAVDMESSIIYSAAKSANIKACAVMYISDHLQKAPFGTVINALSKEKISSARKKLSQIILDAINGK